LSAVSGERQFGIALPFCKLPIEIGRGQSIFNGSLKLFNSRNKRRGLAGRVFRGPSARIFRRGNSGISTETVRAHARSGPLKSVSFFTNRGKSSTDFVGWADDWKFRRREGAKFLRPSILRRYVIPTCEGCGGQNFRYADADREAYF
jgi:hypothetical protein